uniref:(California timema) hypothetical protein n=1 Tax=Timema californicum TaxID=61474 RepID=A0A7R9IXA3_TIMCA|nr:unnamed protein product [Timema californicum]
MVQKFCKEQHSIQEKEQKEENEREKAEELERLKEMEEDKKRLLAEEKNQTALKFDVNVLKNSDRAPGTADKSLLETTKTRDPTIFTMPRNKQTSPGITFTPMPNSTSNWLNLVSQFKSAAFTIPPPTSSHHDSADK